MMMIIMITVIIIIINMRTASFRGPSRRQINNKFILHPDHVISIHG